MNTVKVIVNLPKQQMVKIQALATLKDLTVTDVLMQAIRTELFLQEEIRKGNKVLLENNQKYRQIFFGD